MQIDFCESLNGRMRDELLNESLFFSLDHARMQHSAWTDDCDKRRAHATLDYVPPATYAAKLTNPAQALSKPAEAPIVTG